MDKDGPGVSRPQTISHLREAGSRTGKPTASPPEEIPRNSHRGGRDASGTPPATGLVMRRSLALVLGLLTLSTAACAAPEEDVASSDGQAMAADEKVVEAVPLGAAGELQVSSTAPKATGAASWRAFRVAKGEAAKAVEVFVAQSAQGEPLYEVALLEGGKEVQLRDPSGAPIRPVEGTRAILVGETRVELDAVAADFTALANRLAPDAGKTETQGLRIQTAGDTSKPSCASAVGNALFWAGATLAGATVTTFACASIVASYGVSSVACGVGVYGTWDWAKTAKDDAKTAYRTCSR